MSKITNRKVLLSEALQISLLLKVVNIEAYAVDGLRREMATYVTKRFFPQYVEKAIQHNLYRLIGAYMNNNPIGVAEIIYDTNCPIRNIKVPELSKLYILERFNGKGVGHRLLHEVENNLLNNGYDELYLEVYSENPKAISFYERHMYQKLDKVDFPMQDNVHKNWVMTKKLR